MLAGGRRWLLSLVAASARCGVVLLQCRPPPAASLAFARDSNPRCVLCCELDPKGQVPINH